MDILGDWCMFLWGHYCLCPIEYSLHYTVVEQSYFFFLSFKTDDFSRYQLKG